MTSTGKTILGIIILIILAGAIWTVAKKPTADTTIPADQSVTQPQTGDTTSTNPQSNSSVDSSDASINSDMTSINTQMQGLQTDNASANETVQ